MTHEIKNPEKPTYFIAYSKEVAHVGVVFPYQTVTTGQPNFYYSTDPQEFLEQTKDISMPDLPELSEDTQIAAGVYLRNGERVLMTIDRSIISLEDIIDPITDKV